MNKNTENSTTECSTPKMNRTVRIAEPSDLPFVLDLQKRWSNNLGFLTKSALAEYIGTHQLLVVLENDQHAGYLNWTCTKTGLVRIPQVALEPELLRTTIGTKIISHLQRAAKRGHCSVIRLRSRSDLPANKFWPSLGFHITATFLNKTKRMLPLFEWTLPLLSPDDLSQGLLTHGKSFRPILRNRPAPDLLAQLITGPIPQPVP